MKSLIIVTLALPLHASPFFPTNNHKSWGYDRPGANGTRAPELSPPPPLITAAALPPLSGPSIALPPTPEHSSGVLPPSPPVVSPKLPDNGSTDVSDSPPCESTAPYEAAPTATDIVPTSKYGHVSHTIPISTALSGVVSTSTITQIVPSGEPECTEASSSWDSASPPPDVVSVILSTSTHTKNVARLTPTSALTTVVTSSKITSSTIASPVEQFTGGVVAAAGVTLNAVLGVAVLVGLALA